MSVEELFVGGVSLTLGVFTLFAAVLNWEWYYQRRRAKWIEKMWGRGGARLFHGLLGVLLIALGLAIGFGFSPSESKSRQSKPAGSPAVNAD